jgi:glucokinase
MSEPKHYVGLDVGGTSMKAGVVDDAGLVRSSVCVPTEAARGQEHGLDRMAAAIREAVTQARLSLSQILAVGVATPGTMDIPGGVMIDPPNLRPWKNVPVRQYIADAFGKPTAFQNDGNAAALGEAWAGAGRGAHSLVLFTLGTGVGGGVIIGGRVLEGEHSHGAELGHMRIELTNPRPCSCGRAGCLEAYASATAVVKRAQEAMAAGTPSTHLHRRWNSDAELTARDVFLAAQEGDAVAEKVVEDTAFYLAVGAVNAMHAIDPDVVLFGGGMVGAGDDFLGRIRRHVRALALPIPAERTKIRFADLGSDAGFIGAAACGRQLVRGGR